MNLKDIKFYDFQVKAIADIREAFKSHNKVAFCAMTGSGKTAIACELTRLALEKNKKVLFVVRSDKLVKQTLNIFEKNFKDVGLIRRIRKEIRPVSVASIDSIISNKIKEVKIQAYYDFVIVDEAHRATSLGFINFLKNINPGAKILGLSATYGLNNKKAHTFWEKFIKGPDGFKLASLGLIPEFKKIYLPKFSYNTSDVAVSSTGDYKTAELESCMNKDVKLFGNILKMFKKEAVNKPSICFCVNINHVEKVKKLLSSYNTVVFHSKLSAKELREQENNLEFFRTFKDPYCIISVDMLSAGVDIPDLEVALMLRPTKSENLFRQQVGRLTRNDPNKKKTITLIDFTNNTKTYGHVYNMMEPVRFTEQKSKKPSIRFFRCPKCFYSTLKAFVKCPNCFHVKPVVASSPAHNESTELVEANLKEIQEKYIKKLAIIKKEVENLLSI